MFIRDIFWFIKSLLYYNYILIQIAYSFVIHPQKRPLVRELLTAVMQRMVELRQALVEYKGSDYISIEDILFDFKLTPNDIEIPIPDFFRAEVNEKKQTIIDIFKEIQLINLEGKDSHKQLTQMSIADAIKIIQRNERGRQAKVRLKFMNDVQKMDNMEIEAPRRNIEESAIKIQKAYRSFSAKKKYDIEKQRDSFFLGMSYQHTSNVDNTWVVKNNNRIQDLQKINIEDYKKCLVSVKEK